MRFYLLSFIYKKQKMNVDKVWINPYIYLALKINKFEIIWFSYEIFPKHQKVIEQIFGVLNKEEKKEMIDLLKNRQSSKGLYFFG